MSDLVTAYWTCIYPVEIPGQGTIEHGGPAQVPRAEAEASDNWRLSPLPKAKPRQRRARRKATAKPAAPTPPAPTPEPESTPEGSAPSTSEETS